MTRTCFTLQCCHLAVGGISPKPSCSSTFPLTQPHPPTPKKAEQMGEGGEIGYSNRM